MITFATLPKAFLGHIGIIQKNALRSWLQITPRPQVIVFGKEEGVAEAARELGIDHIPEVPSNEFGIPYVDGVFAKIEEEAKGDLICYSNCDIILFPNLQEALEEAQKKFSHFLLVGECTNLDVKTPIDFSADWQNVLQKAALERGKRRGVCADYFAYTRGFYKDIPPLILGRAFYDNWAIYDARRRSLPVIDATARVTAIHQNHFYAAVPGETANSHKGIEAHENLRIMGGWKNVYWITDATYRLTVQGWKRNIAATLLLRQRFDRVRKAVLYPLVTIRKKFVG